MNKTQLVTVVADRLGISKTVAEATVAAVLDTIQGAVAAGDDVQITGFGTFKRTYREGGEMRTPQGGTVHVPAKHVPGFKAGANFKAAVNEGSSAALVSA